MLFLEPIQFQIHCQLPVALRESHGHESLWIKLAACLEADLMVRQDALRHLRVGEILDIMGEETVDEAPGVAPFCCLETELAWGGNGEKWDEMA